MSTAAANKTIQQELAQRVSGGLEVTLFRGERDSSTHIELRHVAITEPISFRVPPDRALDAFHHPFVYLEERLEITQWMLGDAELAR
jgi:hypothetical protein